MANEIDNGEIARRIARLESEMRRSDPDLVARFRAMPRDGVGVPAILVLLVVACATLCLGLARASVLLWLLGVGALTAAFIAEATRSDHQ